MSSPLGRLQVSDEEIIDIQSGDALRAAVVAAAARARDAERPQFVELVLADGQTLGLGVGLDLTVLSYVPADNEPPYFVSRAGAPADEADGDEDGDADGDEDDDDDDDDLGFDYGGEWSEFPLGTAVPFDVGVDVFVEFLTTGARSTLIEWEEA